MAKGNGSGHFCKPIFDDAQEVCAEIWNSTLVNFPPLRDVPLSDAHWGLCNRRKSTAMIILKRVYDNDIDPRAFSILVDRLWPRGLSRDDIRPDEWFKDLAPSNELRKWFGHDPGKWVSFRKKYVHELNAKADALHTLKELEKKHHTITLLYGAKDTLHNNAVVLKEVLESM